MGTSGKSDSWGFPRLIDASEAAASEMVVVYVYVCIDISIGANSKNIEKVENMANEKNIKNMYLII